MSHAFFGDDANNLGRERDICCSLGCDEPSIIAAGPTPLCQKHLIKVYRAIGEYLRSQQGESPDSESPIERWKKIWEPLPDMFECRMCHWRLIRHRESGEVFCTNTKDCGWFSPPDEWEDWSARVIAARAEVNEVVYYVRFGDRVKIGTTKNLDKRLPFIPHDEVMATEPGGPYVEQQRHKQFKHLRAKVGRSREWFRLAPELVEHIAGVKARAELASTDRS